MDDRSDNIRDLIQIFTQTIDWIYLVYKDKCTGHAFTLTIKESLGSICSLHYHVLDALSGELVRRGNFDLYRNVLSRPLSNAAEQKALDHVLSRAISKFRHSDIAIPINRDLIDAFLRSDFQSEDFFIQESYNIESQLAHKFEGIPQEPFSSG